MRGHSKTVKNLRLAFTAAAGLAATGLNAQEATIPVAARPAGYQTEKALFLAKLAAEQIPGEGFNRNGFAPDYFDKNHCVTIAGTENSGGEKVRESVRTLRESDTFSGQALLPFIRKHGVWFCENKIEQGGIWALAHAPAGIITYNGYKLQYRLQAVTAHETLHVIGDSRRISSISQNSNLYSNQVQKLLLEAAGHALEVMYAFELAQSGDTRAWAGLAAPLQFTDQTARPSPYLKLMDAFSKIYAAEIAGGGTHLAALEKAGAATVETFMLQDKTKQYIYNEVAFMDYAVRIGKGVYYTGPGENTLDISLLRQYGKVSEELNVTRNFEIPARESLLGGNIELRQAFEAVESYRLKKWLGADHPRTIASKQAALADNNPYADVDFAEVEKRMPGALYGRVERGVFEVMNELAGKTPAGSPVHAHKPQRKAVP